MPGVQGPGAQRSEHAQPEPLPTASGRARGNPRTPVLTGGRRLRLPYMTLRGPCRAPLKTCFCRSLLQIQKAKEKK